MDPSENQIPAQVSSEVPKKARKPRAKVTAYTRLAKILKEEGRYDLSRECLKAAELKADELETAELKSAHDALSTPADTEESSRQSKRQRVDSSQISSARGIEKLPEEILNLILKQVPSHHAIISTCRFWRQIVLADAARWRSLKLTRDMPLIQCLEVLNAYTLRSKSSLEVVELAQKDKPFTDSHAQICQILVQSAATLRHIKIPGLFQRGCYEKLYRHCPNLKHLDIDNEEELGEPYLFPTSEDFFPREKEINGTFQLESFKGRHGYVYGYDLPDMGKMRSIHRMNDPYWDLPRCEKFVGALIDQRDTLEELIFYSRTTWIEKYLLKFPRALYGTLDTSEMLPFNKLRVLGGINLAFESDFDFPALEEAVDLRHEDDEAEDLNVSIFFEFNLRLRKVEFDATFCHDDTLGELIHVLRKLELLEDLTLTLHSDYARRDAAFERIFEPHKRVTDPDRVTVPCPRLKHLSIQYKFQAIQPLIRVLAARKYIFLGYIFDHNQNSARSQTISHPHDIKEGTFSPFQQGHCIRPNEVEVSRLESLQLCKIAIPDGAVDLLHEFADSVIFRPGPIKRCRGVILRTPTFKDKA